MIWLESSLPPSSLVSWYFSIASPTCFIFSFFFGFLVGLLCCFLSGFLLLFGFFWFGWCLNEYSVLVSVCVLV